MDYTSNNNTQRMRQSMVTNNGTADVTVAANSAFIVRRLA